MSHETPLMNIDTVDGWVESSDTVRITGRSRAILVETPKGRGVTLFALLLPQPNGACFAGIWHDLAYRLNSAMGGIRVRVRSWGDLRQWKILLSNATHYPYTYQSTFSLDVPTDAFQDIDVPWSSFVAVYRGDRIDAKELAPEDMRRVGIQASGGKGYQAGVGALEVTWATTLTY